MIQWLFGLREGNRGDETGTLIWTTLVMNFGLSWKKQQIPFFYQEKPSDLSAALRWRMDGSKVLHDASSLQNNVMLIAKESMWWGKVRAVGAVPGVIFGLSALWRETCHRTVLPQLHTVALGRSPVCVSLGQIVQRQPTPPAWFHLWETVFSYQPAAFGCVKCAVTVTFVNAFLAI